MNCLLSILMNAPRRLRLLSGLALVILATLFGAQPASATPCSATATFLPAPSPGVVPANCSGIGAGTLLASISAPFTASSGMVSGKIVSAVYQETGGTLDFLYQVTNNSTCPSPPCDPIIRETDSVFTGFTTGVATREDGGNTSATTGLGASDPFVNGGNPSPFADRDATADTVGWNFMGGDQISPGAWSFVLVITTNATLYEPGNAFAIDGGVTPLASFEPAAPVPEPSSLFLFASGLLSVAGALRRTWFT